MARAVVDDPGETPPPSPLYCRYYGFLIGHALALAFDDGDGVGDGTAAGDDPGYAERRVHLLACLRELGIDVSIPESPARRGGVTHAALLAAILPRLAQQARELAEFAILGGLLVHHARASRRAADAAAALRLEIERLREVYDLPPIDPLRHAPAAHAGEPGRVLASGLAYLGEIVERVPVEADTALVLMPVAPPYAEFYERFHRPALEQSGYRALRVWGGIGGDAAPSLVLGLLARAGLVWADVSDIDPSVVFAIGAAQALGKPGMIVVCEDRAAAVPRHVGHDAVIRYDPRAADWPEGPVLLMAACQAGITLAAERGDRLRVTAGSIEAAFDEVSQALGRILLPPEAREAQRRARRALDAEVRHERDAFPARVTF